MNDESAAAPLTPAALPVVALIGRPNVGKSTIFNTLSQSRDAIVTDLPGVTRDRRYGVCRMSSPFVLVDTGGIGEPDMLLAKEVERQSRLAIAEADLLVLVTDAKAGILASDLELARELRTHGKPMVVAVNKCDGVDPDVALAEAAVTGLPCVAVAALHKRNLSELLEFIAETLKLPEGAELAREGFDPDLIRVAVVGKPNVGKSTLINRLLGEERLLAADRPGTTRDSIDVRLERDGKRFLFVDTAGIRRRGKVDEAVEKFSVIKALQALEQAQVAIIMIDAQQGVTDQDGQILGYALNAGRGIVLALNKWDGLERHQRTQVERELERRLDYVPFAPRVEISALHGSGLKELTHAVVKVHRSVETEFSASELTEAFQEAFERYQPPLVNGRTARFRYAHQGGKNPPRMVVHGSRLDTLPDSYKRYLENQLRERFKLVGTPIRFEFKAGTNPFEGKRNELTERQKKKRERLRRHVKKSR
jgi:GTP-binding protein